MEIEVGLPQIQIYENERDFCIFLVLVKVLHLSRNMMKYTQVFFFGSNQCYHPGFSSKRMHMRGMTEKNREGHEHLRHLELQHELFKWGQIPPCCRAVSPHHAKFSDFIYVSQLAAPQFCFPHITSHFCTPFTSVIGLNPLFSSTHLLPNECGYQYFSQKS